MSIVLIIIYCLVAAIFIFGLTFHDELLDEEQRRRNVAGSLRVIQGGEKDLRRLRRHL
jgi:hypothetical protein